MPSPRLPGRINPRCSSCRGKALSTRRQSYSMPVYSARDKVSLKLILRGGQVSGHCMPAQCSDLELARLMVGEAEGLSEQYPKASGQRMLSGHGMSAS